MKKTRHILGLSGGKDSTALAIYMRDKVPNMEYVFTDTGAELPETYEFLEKLEAFLGKKVVRLNAETAFDDLLERKNGYLPSPRARWCTVALKIVPFEKYVGDDDVYSYVGIRADENRSGYVSSKPNIKPVFPFKEAGITLKEVQEILDTAGVGLPKYYEWRSRSGCYFCFFQQRKEWVGLLRRHPDLYEKAKAYEKTQGDKKFTWVEGSTLKDVERNADEIMRRADEKALKEEKNKKKLTLFEILNSETEDKNDQSCLICEL
ncbi:MAG: phosphoadenosine phosphosulfate reductase family protein [Bdellovibrionales bacterium]